MGLEERTEKLQISGKDPKDEALKTPPPDGTAAAAPGSSSKPKRVRTGCLTCRERHLKCDEGVPICQNCKKSQRTCKRGVRLNFIDTKVEDGHHVVPPSADWVINFQDESRDIASEYKGGAEIYANIPVDAMDDVRKDSTVTVQDTAKATLNVLNAPTLPNRSLPTKKASPPQFGSHTNELMPGQHSRRESTVSVASSEPFYSNTGYNPIPQSSDMPAEYSLEGKGPIHMLTDPEETLYLQVFVEEVGLWMDSMNSKKYFSRILPFYAFKEPMLLYAMLSCGARHLSLVNSQFKEDKPLWYYETATRTLLNTLQNPNRDSIICAVTAVVLNVYEVMTEKALQRMNHIAGARALVRECRWDARAIGVGSACFWLNVGMELLSCLHFNWQVAWNPDEWGLDPRMEREISPGNEEAWCHRALFQCAKVCNFRATAPRFKENHSAVQEMREMERCKQWEELVAMVNQWNECVPRTMQPACVIPPERSNSRSSFPEVWIIKRSSIMGRLFFHTSMCLLAQLHPKRKVTEDKDLFDMQTFHARMICGIVAHCKDRGVASAALRCIGVAAECLTELREQYEILSILRKIKRETGWRIDFLEPELRGKWRWSDDYLRRMHSLPQYADLAMDILNYGPAPPPPAPPSSTTGADTASSVNTGSTGPSSPRSTAPSTAGGSSPPAPQSGQIPSGIVNPTMRLGDFNAPNHAYQNYWVAPNPEHGQMSYAMEMG